MFRNKCRKTGILILFAAAVVFTLSSCKKEPPPEESPEEMPAQKSSEQTAGGPSEPLVIELGVGVGQIKFGMSKEEVIEHLGEPDKTEGRGQGLNYTTSKGISLFVSPRRGVQTIDCWSDQYPSPFAKISNFTGRTKEGITMGASREQITDAYGQPDDVTTQGPMTTLHYNKLQSNFMLMQNRLVNLKMNAPR